MADWSNDADWSNTVDWSTIGGVDNDWADNGDWASNNDWIGLLAAAPPSAPGGVTATALDDDSIQIDWVDVANETGYRVERSADGLGGWVDVSGNLPADTITWTDTGLDPETPYFYRVIAFNLNGDSVPSATATATTLAVCQCHLRGRLIAFCEIAC